MTPEQRNLTERVAKLEADFSLLVQGIEAVCVKRGIDIDEVAAAAAAPAEPSYGPLVAIAGGKR
jgi:hypothetical protein